MPFGFNSRNASPIAVGRLRQRPPFPSPRQPRQESTAGATPLPAPCLARLPAGLGPRLIPSAAGNPLIIDKINFFRACGSPPLLLSSHLSVGKHFLALLALHSSAGSALVLARLAVLSVGCFLLLRRCLSRSNAVAELLVLSDMLGLANLLGFADLLELANLQGLSNLLGLANLLVLNDRHLHGLSNLLGLANLLVLNDRHLHVFLRFEAQPLPLAPELRKQALHQLPQAGVCRPAGACQLTGAFQSAGACQPAGAELGISTPCTSFHKLGFADLLELANLQGLSNLLGLANLLVLNDRHLHVFLRFEAQPLPLAPELRKQALHQLPQARLPGLAGVCACSGLGQLLRQELDEGGLHVARPCHHRLSNQQFARFCNERLFPLLKHQLEVLRAVLIGPLLPLLRLLAVAVLLGVHLELRLEEDLVGGGSAMDDHVLVPVHDHVAVLGQLGRLLHLVGLEGSLLLPPLVILGLPGLGHEGSQLFRRPD
ncbi:hypothetical protein C7M84_024173 [Penaeus vannamei]|uniref:Uncharacterized protein n=1 Tax=Penaeus vannamei TaxID=6689 RepID=A0A423U1S6_PENVA|nr:hypothetical protein C7M84_024173 [Penaeus vannamei]